MYRVALTLWTPWEVVFLIYEGLKGDRYLGLSGSVEDFDATKEKYELEVEEIVGVRDKDIAEW